LQVLLAVGLGNSGDLVSQRLLKSEAKAVTEGSGLFLNEQPVEGNVFEIEIAGEVIGKHQCLTGSGSGLDAVLEAGFAVLHSFTDQSGDVRLFQLSFYELGPLGYEDAEEVLVGSRRPRIQPVVVPGDAEYPPQSAAFEVIEDAVGQVPRDPNVPLVPALWVRARR